MIMDCEKYVGKCVCGRDHELETKRSSSNTAR